MISRSFKQDWYLKFDKGDEIVSILTEFCVENKIIMASITAIGAIDTADIGFYSVDNQVYEHNVLQENLEIVNITGNVQIKENKIQPHLHATLSDEKLQTYAGHLFMARVSVVCEMFIHVL